MLRMSSSTDSSTSATQIVVAYDGVGGGKSIKKSSRVKKSAKSKKPQKFAKTIDSEEPSFLTSKTRLAFTKMGSSRTKLTMENQCGQ